MVLDYSLINSTERLEYIKSLPLQTYPPKTLEYITNYILYGKQPSTNSKDEKYAELAEEHNPTQTQTQTRYTAPKPQIPWHHPELIPLAQTRNYIDQLIQNSTNTRTIAQLKRLKREIAQDAAPILSVYCPITHFPATYSLPTPIDISEHIDYTNSFHIKHIILHYSQLRQSEYSKYDMEYFDSIVENTKMPDWQKYMLIRRIDGASANIIGFEIAEKFQRIISTSYMSTIMRSIYKSLAKTATQLQLEHIHRNNPTHWKTCPNCGRTLYNNSYYWYDKRKFCKQCERSKNNAQI